MTQSCVADASVVIDAWFDPTDVGQRSRELLRTRSIYVPELLFTEVTRVLRRFELGGALGIEEDVRRLWASPWQVIPASAYGPRVWALRHDVSISDAFYVALAQALRIPLATHDRKLAATAARYCEVIKSVQ